MPADRVWSNSPWHVVLVLDDSESMSGQPVKDVNQAVTTMVDEMKIISGGLKPYFKLSIVKFGSVPKVLAECQSEQTINLNSAVSLAGNSGSTDAAAALSAAARVLEKNPGRDTDFTPYVFFLSDGAPDDEQAALKAADSLKKLSIAAGTPRIVSVGFGDVNDDFMRKVASTPELYKGFASSADMARFFPVIGTIAATASGTKGVDDGIMNL
jgi:uncharacterized protein YegL